MSTVKTSKLLLAGYTMIWQGQEEFHIAFRPMVKYVANIHGDEAVTRELLLGLAQHLVWNYGTDQRVTHLLNNTEVREQQFIFKMKFFPAFALWCTLCSSKILMIPILS